MPVANGAAIRGLRVLREEAEGLLEEAGVNLVVRRAEVV